MTLRTEKCRHGTLSWLNEDEFVGRALATYGEYSEGEVEMFRQVLNPGDVVIDVGANIGSHTIPMAKLVGSTGKVYAFEPGGNNEPILRKNVEQNDLTGVVEIHNCAAGAKPGSVEVAQVASLNLWRRPSDVMADGKTPVKLLGEPVSVPVETIDSLDLTKLRFVKIDVDGMEIDVLTGMDETIKKCRPIIYIENEQQEQCAALIGHLADRGYRMYWHRPSQFNPDNFKGEKRNWFGKIVSIMMLCVPEEFADVTIEGLEEVADNRNDDGMFEREIVRYGRYVKRNPEDLQARLMLAHNLNLMQRAQEADEQIDEILKRKPDHVAAQALRGLLQLQRGDWENGWQAFSLRFRQQNLRSFGGHRKKTHDDAAPEWDGKPTNDTVLIWSEQGFGDMIMFARFIPQILELAPNAIFECHSSLVELFNYSFPSAVFYPLYRTLPSYDRQCSLPSICTVLKSTPETMSMSEPYLFADPALVEVWKERGNPTGIGICHRGSPRSERPLTRDIDPAVLDPLTERWGPFLALYQTGQFENFMDTAAAIETVELVITVDTSIAHLAGAMGKEVWLMLAFDPDWRWGLKGISTLWYPSMEIFRQPKFKDWDSVVRNVVAALEQREQDKAA